MNVPPLSRRRFVSAFGAAVGVAAVRPPAAAGGVPHDAGGPPVIDLSSNENPYGPSSEALDAMTRSQAVAARYPDASEQQTIEAIARHHGVSPERIVLGCGSSEVLRLCDAAFLSPGRTVVAAEPTFEAVLHYAKVTAAEPVKVPLTADFRHDLPAMARACDARAGLVYVCNPNNPTGTIVGGDELLSFLDRVPPTAAVVVDEAYHHFVEDPRYRSAVEMVDRFPNVVVTRTFSKVYGMAGMRLGYAVSSLANAKTLRAHASWSNVNAAVLAAARASLADEGLPARLRERLNGTRSWLCAELAREGRRVIPSHANFVMIEVGGDVKPLIAAFEARGIRVGRRFAAMPSWLRVTIGTPEETRAFLGAFRELVAARPAAA
ncbi:MAG TPA: histidinol-phosphate transaminase [Vicinamibacteria bacterium]|nr:histidinol-phosphate transaminase [Vicinamibacteria bacterium]